MPDGQPIAPRICGWCDNLDDPAQNLPCPCRAYREPTAAPTPGKCATRPDRPDAEPPTRPTAVPVSTLHERRAAYAPLTVPVLDVIAAAAAEQTGRGAA